MLKEKLKKAIAQILVIIAIAMVTIINIPAGKVYASTLEPANDQKIEYRAISQEVVNGKKQLIIEIKIELMKLNQALYEKFGYEMKYMRPPKGEFSERTLSITDSLGFKTVMWSFAYVDWNDDKQPSKEEAMKKIISNLHNGEIMLLHATSKTNSEIMGEMVDKIKEEGYEIKSLEEFR